MMQTEDNCVSSVADNSSRCERWDLYDENRKPLGRTMVRGTKNAAGEYHIVVHVCVFDARGRMLIQQRAHEKNTWPDKWDFTIGGHVVAGETSRQGAERELNEELGLKCALSDPAYFTINFSDGFDDYYFITAPVDLTDITLQKEEVQNVAWATKKEIKNMIADGSFIDYHCGLVDLIYAMHECRGAHKSSGTKEMEIKN